MFQCMNSNLYPARIIRQLVDSAFQGCHASADNTLLNLHNSSDYTQPHPLTANYADGDGC